MSSITVSSLVLGSLTVEVDGSDSILALSVLGTAPASLSIELGTPGATGTAATIAVGTTTTLSPGASATVANVGTSSAAVFNFGIPTGQTGPTGATGATGSPGTAATIAAGTTTTGAPGSSATVTNSGTTSAAVFDFAIPRGDVGATGATGATGAAGPGVAVGGTTGQLLAKASGTNYDTTWTTVTPGDRYLTTSTTSLTINNATKTLTVGTGLSYTPTQNVTIAYDASNHMHGEVLTYDSGTGVMTVDVNHHTGSGTYAAWTVNVGGVTPVTSTAWGAITGTLSAQTDLQTALDAKSPLASPTFTGVPAAPTATAGTNTTQLATTAFVTAAVPAFATAAETRSGTSTTTSIHPRDLAWSRQSNSNRSLTPSVGQFTSTTTGAGAGGQLGIFQRQSYCTGVGTHNYSTRVAASHFNMGLYVGTGGSSNNSQLNYSGLIWISARWYLDMATANNTVRTKFGHGYGASVTGNLNSRGFGVKVSNRGGALVLCHHNGTTSTETTSSFTPAQYEVFDWDIISQSGTVTLYVNGSSVASSSTAVPTGLQGGDFGWQSENVTVTSNTYTSVLNEFAGNIFATA